MARSGQNLGYLGRTSTLFAGCFQRTRNIQAIISLIHPVLSFYNFPSSSGDSGCSIFRSIKLTSQTSQQDKHERLPTALWLLAQTWHDIYEFMSRHKYHYSRDESPLCCSFRTHAPLVTAKWFLFLLTKLSTDESLYTTLTQQRQSGISSL